MSKSLRTCTMDFLIILNQMTCYKTLVLQKYSNLNWEISLSDLSTQLITNYGFEEHILIA